MGSGPNVQERTAVELAELLEYGEGDMAAATYRTPVPGGAGLALEVYETAGAICMIAPELPAHSRYNVVLGLGVRERATEAALERISAQYQAAGTKGFSVAVSPAAQPALLTQWLEARGFRHVVNLAKCYRSVDLVPAVETDLQVRRVGPEYAQVWAEVTLGAFHWPESMRRWLEAQVGQTGYHFLAFDGATPVAAAALYVQGTVASLHTDGTLPSHRGRGAQKALQAARLTFAAELGCRWAVTETPEETPERPNPSYRSMMRMGFRLGYLRPHYAWAGFLA